MKITIHREFATRSELDAFVESRLDGEKSGTIEVTSEDASRLGLSKKSKVFGLRCQIKEE